MTYIELRDPSLLVQSAFIGGEWTGAAASPTLAVEDPATGAMIGTIPDCGAAETRDAIAAASAAFGPWRRRTAGDRAAFLERWHALVLDNAGDLARILTAEQGKPLDEAEVEVRYGGAFIKWFAEEARRIGGHSVPAPQADRRILVMKEPVGVTAAVTDTRAPESRSRRTDGTLVMVSPTTGSFDARASIT